MTIKHAFCFLWFLALLPGATAQAAVLTLDQQGPCNFRLDGDIVQGDFERIVAAKDDYFVHNGESTGQTIACLNSPGGNLYEGLKIAEFFYETGVGTYINENDECSSVCAIIFMMGVAKGAEVAYVNRQLHVKGLLGIHRPYMTLDDARSYTSGDINDAYDLGIDAVYILIDLANKKAPWSAKTMIPSDLLTRMLSVPGSNIYYIRFIEEVIRWDIKLDGVAELVSQPQYQHLHFACENVLASPVGFASQMDRGIDWVDRGDGEMTEAAFSFSSPPEYTISQITGEWSGRQIPVVALNNEYSVPSLRAGYAGVGCSVRPERNYVAICGRDETTDTTIGDCASEYGRRDFSHISYYHPRTEIYALSVPMLLKGAVGGRITECLVLSPGGGQIDKEACFHTISYNRTPDGIFKLHRFFWPSGAVTVVTVRPENNERHGAIMINGSQGDRLENQENCIRNTQTGNIFCIDNEAR